MSDGAPDLCTIPAGCAGSGDCNAGDAFIALPTLVHRGPGTIGCTSTRHVLFFVIQPEYLDSAPPGEGEESHDKFDPNLQVHAAFLLYHEPKGTTNARRNMVKAMYSAAGYNLECHMPQDMQHRTHNRLEGWTFLKISAP